MLALPEVIFVLEQGLGNSRLVFPVLPLCPVLAEIPAVPEHVRTKCVMGKDQIIALFR